MRETPIVWEKKQRNRQKLIERYYGKMDILNSWEERDLKSAPKSGKPEEVAPAYICDLRRRVRGHSLDLCYRGMDGFTENGESTANVTPG